jgi:DNA-directed RNA polymerase specialized sigma24 family protein
MSGRRPPAAEPALHWRERLYDPAVLRRTQDRLGAAPAPDDSEGERPGPRLSLEDVRRLPPRERLAILGLFWGELSREELGSALRMGPRQLRLLIARAMKGLKAAAEDACGAEA